MESASSNVYRFGYKERTCKCGWVHFGVSREYAKNEVKNFNEWYSIQPQETKDYYSGPATILDYEHCRRCGGSYIHFRDFKEGDCPNGCTLSPIIYE